jgi:hypothetical protein
MTCLQTLYGWKTAGLTTYFHNYIGIDHKTASYAKLIKWWSEIQQIRPFTLETGYKVNTDSDKKWNIPSEILIRLT